MELLKLELKENYILDKPYRIIALESIVLSSGTWIFEMTIDKRAYAMAIGVFNASVLGKYEYNSDSEYLRDFYGYYHGGASFNMIADGKREHSNFKVNNLNWKKDEKVGVIVDIDRGFMKLIHNNKILEYKYVNLPNKVIPFINLHEIDEVKIYIPKRVEINLV